MTTLEVGLKDPAYKHWVKTAHCLALVKEGLEEYAEIKSKEFHDAVLASVAKIQTYQTAICDNERITFDNNNNGKIACNHAFCQGFLNEVVNLGIDPTVKFIIKKANIENCDVKLWPIDHWELAKLFMNQGQKACQTNPSQTDLSGVLNFLEHCKVPRNGIQNARHIAEVRQMRNSVMRASDMKVSTGMFQTYTQTMLDLLRDPNLAKLSSAKKAESEIQKIKDEEEQAGMGEDGCVDEEKVPDPDVEEQDTEGPMTQQHINHARLYNVLVTVCADGLRDILMSQVQPRYASFYHALLANKPTLTAMRQIRQEKDLLFPDPQGRFTGTVDQFDISLLYILIRNISSVPAPSAGWGTPPKDQPRETSLGANVERIRAFRNRVCAHSVDGRLEDQMFEGYWNDIGAIMDDIEISIGPKGYRIALDERKNQVFTIKETLKLKLNELEEAKKNKDEILE